MRRTALLILIAVAALPAVADARPPSHAEAQRALARAQALDKGRGVRTGRELTPALNRLFASLPRLSGDDRRQAEALLARPNDSQSDPSGTHKWTAPPAEQAVECDTHFCVHYVTNAADPDAPDLTDTTPVNGHPDYVDEMLAVFEDEVYPCENGTAPSGCPTGPGLGWRDPASDQGTDGGDEIDIYLEDIGAEKIFGYVALDPGQTQDPSVPHFGYMVLDNDFSQAEFGYADPLVPLSVTAAHEYNHVLQNAYDYLEDPWMFEATAVYMEDKVYPAINDYLNYVTSWVANTRQAITAFPDSNLKPYGSAVWNHWLDHRFGPNAVRGAWEQSIGAGDFAPGAYNAAITGAGGAGFSDEFDHFAATVAEWQAPGAGFPDRYPDVPREAQLPAGSETQPFALAHTTFALFDVPIPAGASTIRLTGKLPAGTNGAIALVGRTGPDPTAGAVTANVATMPTGGTNVVSLDNPAQFGRITAVIANADPSRSGFDPVAADWIFTKDAPDASVALAAPGSPVPVTGGVNSVTDHSAVATGTVDPRLLDTTWSVEFGPTSAYGSTTPTQPAVPGSTVGGAPVSVPIDGLKPNTTYHYRLNATNSAGTTQGADMTFTTARDVTKPIVSFVVKRQKIKTLRSRGLFYLGRCNERCLGSARLVVTRAVARKLSTSTVLGKGRITLDPKPQSVTLRVGMTSKTKKKLKRVKKNFKATLKIRVADEAGNLVTLSRRVTLTR
jgi:hypothetical protein